jgi:DNA-binding response OmpR family regulator
MFSDLKIVLVEDNELLREEMLDFLSRPGWVVQGVDCGEELNRYLAKDTPDLVLLDVNLPYEDGYSIASRLRTTHPDMGIVMLTARVRPVDRTMGYKAGADVYLSKPTHTEELIAVIENLGRRLKRRQIDYFVLDRLSGKLQTPQGRSCALTHSELKLIEVLAMSAGKEVDVDLVLSTLSGKEDKTPTKESLAALISRLRSKCKTELEVDNLIAATRGLGYRLTVPMQLK